MITPKGNRSWKINLTDNDCLHVYSKDCEITLQIRRTIPTEDDLLALSFKVAVRLGTNETLRRAAEFLSTTQTQITRAKKAGKSDKG